MAPAGPPDLRLRRATTRYDADEDRILLVGEDDAGRRQALWLTRRLLVRLLPHLFAWLERQAPPAATRQASVAAPAIQAFTQQAANLARPRLAPVPPPPDGRAWLVRGIAFTARERAVAMTFSSRPQGAGSTVELTLEATPLRRWLDILHGQWTLAGWPPEVWPAWMSAPVAPASAAALH